MKDKVMDYNPVAGNITFEDLLINLKNVLKRYKSLEDTVIYILKTNGYDDKTISSLFVGSITNSLEYIIFLLEKLL